MRRCRQQGRCSVDVYQHLRKVVGISCPVVFLPQPATAANCLHEHKIEHSPRQGWLTDLGKTESNLCPLGIDPRFAAAAGIIIEEKFCLCLGQVGVFGGLALGPRKVVTVNPGGIPQQSQNAKFPFGNIVH